MARTRTELTSADAFWLRMDHPTNLMMITGVLMFEGPLDVDLLRSILRHRFLTFDRFRQRVVEHDGTPCWEDDPYFDLDNHVHRVALPAPGDQDALQELVSDLMSTPLDLSQPLWQFHLVENYDGGSAVIVRLHHCIADGIALVRVLLSLTADTPEASLVVPPDAPELKEDGPLSRLLRPAVRTVEQAVRATEAVAHEAAETVRHPGRVLEWTKQGLSMGAALSRVALLSSDPDTVFKGELQVRKRAAWTLPLPLSDVKAIGESVGGKVNDVLMAVMAGAVRRYLTERGEPVEGVEVRVVVPVNLRPLSEPPTLGNKFGLVFLALPVGLAAAADRLAEVKRRMDRIKGSSEAVVLYGLLQAAGKSPRAVQDQLVRLFSQKATAVATNVPGPRESVYFAGQRMREIMFWVPQSGRLGLGLSILSYTGEVLVGVASDARLVPDPEALVAAVHEEFDALRDEFLDLEDLHQPVR